MPGIQEEDQEEDQEVGSPQNFATIEKKFGDLYLERPDAEYLDWEYKK